MVTEPKLAMDAGIAAFVTVPEFAFQLHGFDSKQGVRGLEGAIGKWSRGATFGYKGAKGAGLDFNKHTLGQMVENARRRGDKIAICQDHLSILGPPAGKPAPSLGFFYALALFDHGTLVDHWSCDGGETPGPLGYDNEPRHGLYCRLGEITPLGFDSKEGLANYGFLSPTFPPPDSATDEAGNPVGYSLIDFAATSAPFQSGCALEFHRLGSVAMAESFKVGDKVKSENHTVGTVQNVDADGTVTVLWDGVGGDMSKDLYTASEAGNLTKMSVAPTPAVRAARARIMAGEWDEDKEGISSVMPTDAVRAMRAKIMAGEWDESKHKRANDGKFGSGGGGSKPASEEEFKHYDSNGKQFKKGDRVINDENQQGRVVEIGRGGIAVKWSGGKTESIESWAAENAISKMTITGRSSMHAMATYRDSKGQTVREGDRVRIISGQWKGVEGKVDQYGGAGVVPVTKDDGSTVLADQKEIVKLSISMALQPGDRVRLRTRGSGRDSAGASGPGPWEGSVVRVDGTAITVATTDRGTKTVPEGDLIKLSNGAASANGGVMNPDLQKKLGFADGAEPNVADKMAAYGKHAMGEATNEECMAMADDLDKHEEPEAKAMARKLRMMGDLDIHHEGGDVSTMADGDDDEDDVTLSDLEDDEDDDEAMSAVGMGKKFPKGSAAAQNAAIHINTGNEHDESSYGSWSGSPRGAKGGKKRKAKRASMLSATEKQAMVALAQSLRSRGVDVPPTATRPVLMALAAQHGATTQPDVSALVRAEIDRQREAEAKAERDKEAKALVAMARSANAPAHEVSALQIVAERDLVTARQMARKYNPEHSGAPAHMFNRMTGPNGPIGANGRTIEQPRTPASVPANGVDRSYVQMGASIAGAKVAVLSAATWASEARALADSKDPVVMARIDSMLDEGIKGSKYEAFERFVAAEKILTADRPDLARAAKLATSLPVGGV